jgi:hypothetical protein
MDTTALAKSKTDRFDVVFIIIVYFVNAIVAVINLFFASRTIEKELEFL